MGGCALIRASASTVEAATRLEDEFVLECGDGGHEEVLPSLGHNKEGNCVRVARVIGIESLSDLASALSDDGLDARCDGLQRRETAEDVSVHAREQCGKMQARTLRCSPN